MRAEDPHDVFAALAAGHALYALEPEDEQAFLAHVAGCAACERDLAEHRETLAHLAYAADAAEPPAALLEGIRAGVRDSGRESTYADPAPRAWAERAPAGPTPIGHARSRRTAGHDRAARLRRAATVLGAAAALVLVASLAVWNTALQRDSRDTGVTLDRLVAALEGQDTRTVPLRSDAGDVLAVAIVGQRDLSLVVDGLAPNDGESSSYVVWGRNPLGGVRAVGAFDIPGDRAQVVRRLPLDGDMTAFMVTHEDGNTPPPVSTRPVLALGEV